MEFSMNLDEAKQIARQYRETLSRVSAAVGLNPVLPEESLPRPRSIIKEAIRLAYEQAGDFGTRQQLLDDYLKLAVFVPETEAEQVAQWIRAAVTGDKDQEAEYHGRAISVLSRSLEVNEELRRELEGTASTSSSQNPPYPSDEVNR